MESMFYATGGGMNSRFYLDISSFNMSKVEDLTGFLDYAGYQANDWTVIIPATNGNGIQNTTTRIYGANESVYYDLPSGREFTIAD